MPRYYFHFTDGTHTFTDAIGIDMVGFADVRARVISHIREIKGALSEQRIQDWAKWKMVVTETSQVTVLEVGFDLKPKPLDESERRGLYYAQQKFRRGG